MDNSTEYQVNTQILYQCGEHLYEGTIIDAKRKDDGKLFYTVHYTGSDKRSDEVISHAKAIQSFKPLTSLNEIQQMEHAPKQLSMSVSTNNENLTSPIATTTDILLEKQVDGKEREKNVARIVQNHGVEEEERSTPRIATKPKKVEGPVKVVLKSVIKQVSTNSQNLTPIITATTDITKKIDEKEAAAAIEKQNVSELLSNIKEPSLRSLLKRRTNSKTNESNIQESVSPSEEPSSSQTTTQSNKRIRTRTSRYIEYEKENKKSNIRKSDNNNNTTMNENATPKQRSRTVASAINNSVKRSGVPKIASSAAAPSKLRTNVKANESNNIHSNEEQPNQTKQTRTRTSRYNEHASGDKEKKVGTKRKNNNNTDVNGNDENHPASKRSRTVINQNVKNAGSKIVYDCQIEGVEKIFDVNKELLSKKSKGFAELFAAAKPDKCYFELEGIPDTTLEALFNFCHGKSLDNDMNIKVFYSLLFFASTFEIPELTNHLEELLVEKISPENVCGITNAAVTAKSEKLQNICKNYLIENVQNNVPLRNYAGLNKKLKDEVCAATITRSA